MILSQKRAIPKKVILNTKDDKKCIKMCQKQNI